MYEILKEIKSKVDTVSERQAERQGESKAQHAQTHARLDVIDESIHHMQEVQIIQGTDIEQNKESLVAHMDNNKKLEELIHATKGNCDSRIDKLEEPKKARKYLMDWFFKLGTAAGAIYAIYRVYEMFFPEA